MARAQRNQIWQEPQARTGQEWNDLRDELEALLDQVNDQQRRMSPEPAERREPRHAPVPAETRRREALRSVQRAVQRFNEHEEAPHMPAQSPERLQSAIDQIRASQNRSFRRAQAGAAHREPANSNQFADLRSAIGEIGERMGRFEQMLQGRQQPDGTVAEIAQQMEQLTGVVEMLAHSVGEQSHIKRLEGQIARLAESVNTGPELDLDTVTERLEVLSSAFDRLSQLQAEQHMPEMPDYGDHFASLESGLRQMSQDVRDLDMSHVTKGVERVSTKLDSMDFSAVEACVRSVYDRIDALENNLAVPTPAIERLTRDLAEFTEVMRNGKGPVVSSTLVTRVDALNARLSEIEDSGQAVDGLKFDMEELRAAVVSAIEPRFTAIETQIGTLADQFSAPSPLDAGQSISGLEDQIRRLADRLDRTGDELTQLQSLYAENNASAPAPDLGALADLVVERTQNAISQARTNSDNGIDAEALQSLEDRLSQMFADQQTMAPAPQDLSGVEQSLQSVNQRLQFLEESLSKADTPPAPEKMSASGIAGAPEHGHQAEMRDEEDEFSASSSGRFRHPGLDDEPAPKTKAKVSPPDTMPKLPTEEAELNAPAYPDPEPAENFGSRRIPVPSNLLSEPDDYAATYGAPDEADQDEEFKNHSAPAGSQAEPVDVPRFDTTEIAPPPPPTSDFAAGNGQSFARDEASKADSRKADETEAGIPSDRGVNRSTFIAAARRAAQQGGGDSDDGSNSLFGRALSRFQKKRADNQTEDEPSRIDVTAPTRDEPKEEPRITDRFEHTSVFENQDGEGGESFLSKYRRPLLLGAALLAVSLLTLNLVAQRLGGAPERTTPTNIETAPAPAEPEDSPEAAPETERPLNGADEVPADNDFPVGSIGDEVSPAGPDVRVIDPASYTDMPAPLELAAFTPDQATAAPEVLAPLPENLGPEGLRQAADGGDARAQFEVAAIYAEGRAVTQDLAAAARWYERAAAQGFAPAAYRLGNMYENGSGVEQDLEKARFWYEKAAGLGNRMSMHNLASILASGALGEQKFGEAATWFEQAAGLGLTDSQFNLGMLYARGLGVPQDMAQSYKWFSIAAGAGDEDAAQARDDVGRSLDAQTVSQLQAETADWAPSQLDLRANFAPIGTWSEDFDPGPAIENRDIVMRVQAALNKLGFDTGTPDGLPGPKTEDAVRAFESATGMSESGEVNPRLLAVLGSQPV